MARISLGRQRVGALFWIGVGLFFVIGITGSRIGSLNNPGPGFLPVCMSLLLICLNVVDILMNARKPVRSFEGLIWRRPVFVLASLSGFCLVFSYSGFAVATFVLMLILFGLLITPRSNKWASVLLYSSLTSLVAWLVFAKALGIYFP
jgi:hypothetical protein